MGAKVFRDSFGDQNHQLKGITALPKEMEFLSYKVLDAEFNKLYLGSREKLHAIAENPSEEMMQNITQRVRQNQTFLANCFNETPLDKVLAEQQSHQDGDYKIPSIESKNIDSYLRSSASYAYGKQPQP